MTLLSPFWIMQQETLSYLPSSLLAKIREFLLRGQNAAGELAHESILVHFLLAWGRWEISSSFWFPAAFLGFSVLPSVEFQQIGQMIDRQDVGRQSVVAETSFYWGEWAKNVQFCLLCIHQMWNVPRLLQSWSIWWAGFLFRLRDPGRLQ